MRTQPTHPGAMSMGARIALSLIVAGTLDMSAVAQPGDELVRQATWDFPAPAEVRRQVLDVVSSQELAPAALQSVQALWPETLDLPQGVELLHHLGATIAIYDKSASELVRLWRGDRPNGGIPTFDFLTREETPPLVRNNLRLLHGRWLAQNDLYDEAGEMLAGLGPNDVIDPATLLFYQCVVHHALFKKDACLAAAQRLLENESSLPRRYTSLAQLMEADIRPLKKDSLDEISRMMADIRRRLELHRAGKRVRTEEDDVIAKLDKLIKKMEKESESVSVASQGSRAPSKPAEQSRALGGSGPGDVDQRRVGEEADWGDLPPKEREEALQQISKDLPAHFREIIEEYFRKLAQDGEQ